MPRILIFIILIGSFFLSSSLSGGSVGVSSTCVNNGCKVMASSSIASMLLGVGLGLFAFYFPRNAFTIDSENTVGLWRRFSAFVLDMITVLLVVSPIIVVPVLIAEASYTGEFTWSFERNFARPTDNMYILPSVLGTFAAMFLYFYLYVRSNSQTVGQYVVGYKVITLDADKGSPQYAKRVLFSFFGLSLWPVSVILALLKPKKSCWWDAITNTEVVRGISVNKKGLSNSGSDS